MSKGSHAVDFRAENIVATFGKRTAVDDVSLLCAAGAVTAIIGPSGCGKSTLLRCFNRLHERVPGARVSGRAFIAGDDIYSSTANVVTLRRRIGMVFQRATPFPTMTVYENVASGIRPGTPGSARGAVRDSVERALRRAALWDDVRDRLNASALSLSGGQQQRLCIARALATEPQVLLLDEPTASLDPLSTQRIEELVYDLRRDVTVIIVTHNLQQAARVSDRTAFMLNGKVVEMSDTGTLFTTPCDSRTEAYVTGRFG
ncbi:MAG: phosphate ABC transporter ATP-binding protein [Gemmatimonadaceae bacterium]